MSHRGPASWLTVITSLSSCRYFLFPPIPKVSGMWRLEESHCQVLGAILWSTFFRIHKHFIQKNGFTACESFWQSNRITVASAGGEGEQWMRAVWRSESNMKWKGVIRQPKSNEIIWSNKTRKSIKGAFMRRWYVLIILFYLVLCLYLITDQEDLFSSVKVLGSQLWEANIEKIWHYKLLREKNMPLYGRWSFDQLCTLCHSNYICS